MHNIYIYARSVIPIRASIKPLRSEDLEIEIELEFYQLKQSLL